MPDGAAVLPDGTETVWRCRECGAGFVPRSCAHAWCSKQCRERQRSREPSRVEAAHVRRAAWQTKNLSYHNVSIALRRRGVLEQYATQLEALKGRGAVPPAELMATFGEALSRRPHYRKRGPAQPAPTLGSWAQAHPYIPRAIAWLHQYGLLTDERRAVLEATTDATSLTDALMRAGVDRADLWQMPSAPFEGPLATAVQLSLVSQSGHPVRGLHDAFRLRQLHAALHHLVGVGHVEHEAAFVLRFDAPGRVWLLTRHEGVLTSLRHAPLVLGDQRTEMTVGARARLRPPPPREPGSYRVTVRTVTPLVLKRTDLSDGTRRVRLRDAPTTLAQHLERVCDRVRATSRPIIADVLSHDVERVLDGDGREGVRVGGHLQFDAERGRVAALVGVLTVECNAPARWLLDAAALVGLGGKTAFGFGRVRLEDA